MTTTEPRTETTELLTDEMLARFDERAPIYDRENRFFDEDFDELRRPATSLAAVPDRARRRRLGLDEYVRLQPPARVRTPRPPRWPSTCTATGRASPPTCCGPATTRAAGCSSKAAAGEVLRRPPRRGRQRPPAACCRPRTAERVDGGWRSAATRSSAACRRCGPTAASTPWTPPTRRTPQIVHGFLPRGHRRAPDRRDVGHARACGRRRARTPCSTRRSCPTSSSSLVCPAGLRRRRAVPRVGLRLGAARLLRGLPRRGPAGLRPHRRADAAAHVDRPDRLDGAPPRGAAQRRRDAHRPRRRRGAARAHRRRLGDRRAEHADWPVRLVGHPVSSSSTRPIDIVDRALDLAGGAGAFKRNRLEQLFRDVRMGRFHPGNTMLAHELIGKLCLGIDPDDPQRWG